LIVFSAEANSLPDEEAFVSLTFPGTNLSAITTLVSTAPGLKLTSDARRVIINIFLFLLNSLKIFQSTKVISFILKEQIVKKNANTVS
jgi:hypothetical protein